MTMYDHRDADLNEVKTSAPGALPTVPVTSAIPPQAPGRAGSMTEIQQIFSEADSRLDEGTKRDHPVQSIDEINAAYPEEWVALMITEVSTRHGGIGAGRVFGHSPYWSTYRKVLASIKSEYPTVAITNHYTGTVIPNQDAMDEY